jgi:hypothetical protein
MRKEHLDIMHHLLTKDLPPSRTCVECGTILPVGDSALNVLHVGQIGSPGHGALEAFQCPEEHWACSPDCWKSASIKCIENDMYPLLVKIHETLGKEVQQHGN